MESDMLGLEEEHAAAAVPLGADERGLSMGEEIITATGIVGEYAHPDAATNPDLFTIHQKRLFECSQHRARDRVRFHARRRAVDEESEGVTADTREGVRHRYRRLEAMGDLDQHAIADSVAERVVDGAEAVEVDGGHGDRPPGVMPLDERPARAAP